MMVTKVNALFWELGFAPLEHFQRKMELKGNIFYDNLAEEERFNMDNFKVSIGLSDLMDSESEFIPIV